MSSEESAEAIWRDNPTFWFVAAAVLGIGLILFKQFVLVGTLGYPAGPSEVNSEADKAEYCSYSTICDNIYPEYSVLDSPSALALLAGAIVLVLLKLRRSNSNDS